MPGSDTGALAIDLGPGVGIVEPNSLSPARPIDRDMSLAARLQTLKDLVLYLHIPCEIVLAGLHYGARGRYCVTAALHLDRVEIRAVGHVVVRIEPALDQVAWLEVHKHIGADTDRREVGRCFPRRPGAAFVR